MGSFVHQALFGIYPYIALTTFLIGSLVRFETDQYGWRSKSSQLLRRRQLIAGSVLFHVGILGILVGHAVGLLTPVALFEFLGISHGFKQLMAIVVGGLFGTSCFVGLVMLLHRRLFDSRIRRSSSVSDIAVLLILFAQLSLGMLTIPLSLGHLDGTMMVKFMNYVQGIVTFRPEPSLIAGVPLVFKLHMVLGFTISSSSPSPAWCTSGVRRSAISSETTRWFAPRDAPRPSPRTRTCSPMSRVAVSVPNTSRAQAERKQPSDQRQRSKDRGSRDRP
ncbi:MAG TPA: respiratory nitrate reductase subunit gamma [Sphingomicrobium sp.]|nr:respiratory nitrate reductase subunit gamma [Sphingomicrobium sp.]